jgi:hypothetical protein
MRRVSTLLLGSSLALSLASLAHANGRFPRAERLLEDPNDGAHLVLAATYGLVVTRDRGQNWHYVCEASFADLEAQTDPVAAITESGALVTSVSSMLTRSEPDACDFSPRLGAADDESVPDFTLARGAGERVVAAHVTAPADGTIVNQLYASDDDGRTFSPLGPPLPSSIRLVATLDVAPSDPSRIYVSGLAQDRTAVFLRSDDGGESFEATTLETNASESETPYIAAVDPDDADIVYVRTDLWQYDEIDGLDIASDGLYFSDDGGATFREVFRTQAKLYGFALAPDGESVLLGYGDPVDGGGRYVIPEALGIYKSPTANGDFSFDKIFAQGVTCLTHTSTALYACAAQSRSGFEVGVRADSDFTLDTPSPFTLLLDLSELRGPLECPACSTGARCAEYWRDTCLRLGAQDCDSGSAGSGGAPECTSEGGAAGDGAGGSSAEGGAAQGGSPGAAAEGGVTNAGQPALGSGGAGNAGANPSFDRDSGCGCRLRGLSTHESAGALAFLSGILVLFRRRRARA